MEIDHYLLFPCYGSIILLPLQHAIKKSVPVAKLKHRFLIFRSLLVLTV